jgi:uncharacterized protein (DUF305 family)
MSITPSRTRRLTLTVAAGAGALALLTACGSSNDVAVKLAGMTDAPSASPSPSRESSASFNDADVMFTQMMIEHHKQAVKMADLAETRAQDPEVKELAAKIKTDQESEIATMTGWLSEWGRSATPSAGMEGHHGMPGMMTDEDMKKLEAAKGTEFDRMFLQMMTAHHKGAIEMAKTEQAQGVNPKARELAATIKTTQQAEISQMQKILGRL